MTKIYPLTGDGQLAAPPGDSRFIEVTAAAVGRGRCAHDETESVVFLVLYTEVDEREEAVEMRFVFSIDAARDIADRMMRMIWNTAAAMNTDQRIRYVPE